ncbi:LysR family transcriptional regulator [Paracoccus sp. (in: a-proteobacteria)]|uniref:LysR family transcriptional regulator n=1 Tax=Paracoccus sp. TaxID=267 RepID=UPI0026DEA991|nr:LysR family transcriptional regulator [Paracoccus sp. (in: a-proteobacteria)]MDO5647779.1 LysR family transcriptional regulator [Paracoccus sp. (in: a-proteobacteria)]
MNWTISEMQTFLAVLDAGSMSAAATRAELSKSVVSKRISDLEAALGVALFTRSAGRITPTDQARALADRLRPALAELVAATEDLNATTELRGRLALSAPLSLGIRHLGPVIAAFAQAHPELELVLDYDDRPVDLVRAGFDLGVRVGRLRDSGLMARRLCADPFALVASPDYLDRHGPIITSVDLLRHQAIGYRNMRLSDQWPFGAQVAVMHTGRLSANNGESMRDLAIGGLGVAMLPLFIVADALRQGQLVWVLPDMPQTPLPISLVWPPIRPMPRKTRLLIDHIAAAFADEPAWQQGLWQP